jgi:hypothetical protein
VVDSRIALQPRKLRETLRSLANYARRSAENRYEVIIQKGSLVCTFWVLL